MQLGLRPRTHFPASYRDFHLVRTHGRVFAAPDYLDPKALLNNGRLFSHPAVFSAATLGEIEARIDALAERPREPAVVARFQGYHLVHFLGALHGVPERAGPIDLAAPEDRRRAGVVSGKSCEELQALIQGLDQATGVEFAGWLPVYEQSGDCGRHPQFTHTAEPPPGYRFTCSAPPVVQRTAVVSTLVAAVTYGLRTLFAKAGACVRPFLAAFQSAPGVKLRDRLRVLAAAAALACRLLRSGARVGPTLRFLLTRHFRSQLLLSPNRGLVFLTSMPYTYGQNPWLIEVEDPTTLFYPLIQNGRTADLPIRESPYYPIVKTLLESDSCKGVVTHIRSTAAMLGNLFDSDVVRRKIHYTPLGVKLPTRRQRHDETDGPIHLLFINSWCQVPENFFVRGGLDLLEAFDVLRRRYPQLRLTLRTALPALDPHYHRIIESGWVRVINRFLPTEELAALHADSHIFMLPAARIHVVSLLQAMSYGVAVVASDGWGIEEYLEHDRNGLVVKGRYGKTTWADETAGVLREDYETMYTSDPAVVDGIVAAVSRLVEDHALRRRLGAQARADVETKYSLANWNAGLKAVFDQALAG